MALTDQPAGAAPAMSDEDARVFRKAKSLSKCSALVLVGSVVINAMLGNGFGAMVSAGAVAVTMCCGVRGLKKGNRRKVLCHARLQFCCGLASMLLIPVVFAGLGTYNCFCSDTCRANFLPDPLDFPLANATTAPLAPAMVPPAEEGHPKPEQPADNAGSAPADNAGSAPADNAGSAPADNAGSGTKVQAGEKPASTSNVRRLSATRLGAHARPVTPDERDAAPAVEPITEEDASGEERDAAPAVEPITEEDASGDERAAGHPRHKRPLFGGMFRRIFGMVLRHHRRRGGRDRPRPRPAMEAVSQAKAAAATAGPHQAWARRSLKHGSGQHADAQRSPDAAKDHHSGWKSVWQSHRHEEEDDTHAGWHGGPSRGDDRRHTHRGHPDDDEDDDSGRAFERVRTREEAQRVVDEVTARAEQVCEVTNGMAPAGAMLAILVLLGSSVLHCATARASHRAAKILAPARRGDAPAPGTAAVLRGAGAPAHTTLHKGGAVTRVDPPAAPAPAAEGASASAAGYPLAGVAAARARLADRMRGMFAGRQGYAAVNVEEDPPRAGPVGSGGGAAPVAPPAAPAGAPLSYDEYLRAVAQGRA